MNCYLLCQPSKLVETLPRLSAAAEAELVLVRQTFSTATKDPSTSEPGNAGLAERTDCIHNGAGAGHVICTRRLVRHLCRKNRNIHSPMRTCSLCITDHSPMRYATARRPNMLARIQEGAFHAQMQTCIVIKLVFWNCWYPVKSTSVMPRDRSRVTTAEAPDWL
jgi:hypothetical protein